MITSRQRWAWQMAASGAMVLGVLSATGIRAQDGIDEEIEETTATGSAQAWQALQLFVGEWHGSGEGRWGRSTVERTYELVLDGYFLFVRNESIYPPQEKNPEGEHHKDWGLYSYDKGRETVVLRQFHNEAIVNRFVLESISPDGKTIVLTTEHMENFRPGWRARETYRFLTDDRYEETFELAPPDGEFQVFLISRLERVR